MKRLWFTREDQQNTLFPVAILFCVLSVFSFLRDFRKTTNPIIYCLLGIAFAVVFYLVFGRITVLSLTKYEVKSDGLAIYYPLRITKFYKWEEFKEIALCKVHYASAANSYKLAIRCSLIEEKHGPKQAIIAKERWQRIEYEAWHFGKIFTIYHTDERYDEFAAAYPYEIKDYQHLDGFYTLSREDFF